MFLKKKKTIVEAVVMTLLPFSYIICWVRQNNWNSLLGVCKTTLIPELNYLGY